MLRRIIGCLAIASVLTFELVGIIAFVFKMSSGSEVSITVIITMFILFLFLFLTCVGVYSVNPTLWNTVHEKRDDLLFRMLPDIYEIVELVDYVSSPRQEPID